MSIAVAVKKGNEIVMAADSQTNFGSSKVRIENHRAEKIRKIGSSLLATTGWALYDNILDDFLARRRVPALTSRKVIFTFYLGFWKLLHERYSLVNDQSDKELDSPFGDMDACFLIANSGGIFYVAGDLSVTEFDEYFAVGSGSDFSLGVLHALYDSDIGAEELARRAVSAAVEFNIYCGGDIQVARAPTRRRGPARRTKRARPADA